MISSLPKPLQNDFDTIVIDILSRYSLENKSVKRFVESVAQQVREINRLPRLLKEAKASRGRPTQNNTTDTETVNSKEKPGMLSRLQGYQSAWNRGSLVGIFLEYLKNKREDQQAKLIPSKQDTITNNTKEKNKQQPIAQAIKSEKETIERFSDKVTETKTNTFERVVNNLQKIQEIFSSPGLLGVTKNILNVSKETELAKPITPLTSSTNYTAPSYSTAVTNNTVSPYDASKINYSTVNTTNTTAANNESIDLTQGEAQAQRQDLLKEEQVIILGGINDKGARDLKKIIASIFEEQGQSLFGAGAAATPLSQTSPDSAEEGNLLDFLADLGMARSLFGRGKGGSGLGGGKKGSRARAKARTQGRGYQTPKPTQKPTPGKPTTPKPKPSAKPGRFIPKPGAGGLLRGIGTLGLGMLADWGGQMAGSEIAEGIYGEEKTAAAYEEYGTDIFGLFKASYDATKAIGEAKEARERLEKTEKQTIPLDIKAMMFGYKDLADFGKAVSSGEEKRRMYWDDKKQAVIVALPNKTQEIHKFTYGKGFQGKPEIIGTDGKPVLSPDSNKQTIGSKPLPVQNPEVKPLPPGLKPPDVEKPFINLIPPVQQPLTSAPITKMQETVKPNSSMLDSNKPPITITPDTTKPVSPTPSSITETHITNNNQDKKVLTDIAGNTEKTNKSLATLGDAVFKLAKVFDSKTMGGGNNIVVNSNGQAQEYTSTSRIAANNFDPIRNVRDQFLATTV